MIDKAYWNKMTAFLYQNRIQVEFPVLILILFRLIVLRMTKSMIFYPNLD